MGKFNKKDEGVKPTIVNHMGEKAYKPNAEEELVSTVMTTMLSDSYYEKEKPKKYVSISSAFLFIFVEKQFVMKQVLFDILPRLKCVGFLDTNAWNPSISTAGITHALQFGNALPKNILGCKQITIIYRPTS